MGTTLEEIKAVGSQCETECFRVALPERDLALEQDAEWCLVEVDGEWREIRFHDYGELYAIPGLYERVFYDILKCDSPATIRRLLHEAVEKDGAAPDRLRVLDVGAGNGMVGEELADIGVNSIVGVDIIEEAVRALDRDRPGVYEAYLVTDLTRLSPDEEAQLASYRFNGLTCVAALGFGDIPTAAFATAYNFVEPGGWIAFNIKENFLNGEDTTGFSRLIRYIIDDGILSVQARKRYRHRLATNGDPLHYVAIVGQKSCDIPGTMVD